MQHNVHYEYATSRNTGMEEGKGDFLTLLDSGDSLYTSYLEDATRFALNSPQYKILHSLYNIVDEEGEGMYKMNFPPIDDSLNHIIKGNYLSFHVVFMARAVYH